MTAGAERPRLTDDGGGRSGSGGAVDEGEGVSETDDYDPAETCLAVGHDDVTIYEDDEVWQGECSRCGAELWSEKDANAMTAHCRTCSCDPLRDAPPQPGASDPRHRAAVIAGVKAVVASRKRARTTVNSEETEQ